MLGNKLKMGDDTVVWDGNDTVYRGLKLTQCVGENLLYINLGNTHNYCHMINNNRVIFRERRKWATEAHK